MWRRANLRRWIAAFRRNPKMSSAGFAVGLLYGAFATFVDHLVAHRDAAPVWFFRLLSISPVVTALLGIAAFVWVAGTLRLPRQRGMIFAVCIFPGAMVELLLSGMIGAIARMIA
jgi:hypothetical protein